MNETTKYIGKNITIKNIKDAILDFQITEIDTILLHLENFSQITNEFKQTYNEDISKYFILLKVYIRVDKSTKTPLNRITIIKNDQDPNRPLTYNI